MSLEKNLWCGKVCRGKKVTTSASQTSRVPIVLQYTNKRRKEGKTNGTNETNGMENVGIQKLIHRELFGKRNRRQRTLIIHGERDENRYGRICFRLSIVGEKTVPARAQLSRSPSFFRLSPATGSLEGIFQLLRAQNLQTSLVQL